MDRLSTSRINEVIKVSWFGLGKKRSKLGKWIDERDITQEKVAEVSKVSRATVGRLCSAGDARPTRRNAIKIVKALRQIAQEEVSISNFWDVED